MYESLLISTSIFTTFRMEKLGRENAKVWHSKLLSQSTTVAASTQSAGSAGTQQTLSVTATTSSQSTQQSASVTTDESTTTSPYTNLFDSFITISAVPQPAWNTWQTTSTDSYHYDRRKRQTTANGKNHVIISISKYITNKPECRK